MSEDPPPESDRSPAAEGGDQEPGADGPSGRGDGATAGAEEDEGQGDPGDGGEDGPTGSTETEAAGSNRTGEGVGIRSVPWLYLLGLLVFVASLGAFLWDLVTGHAIERSLVTNALGTVLLVAWAGYDSYRDPDTGVATRGGAVGTGLILVGIYLFVAGIVVAVTGLIHGRTVLGLGMVAGSVPLVLVGFLSYPTEDVLGVREDADESDDGAAANGSDGSG